jgi:hypothetical protein
MIIAICGLKRVGKDTVANYVVDKYGYKHVKIAETLKNVCKTLFDFKDVESCSKDIVDPTWNITPRLAMQFIGTEVFQFKIQEILPDIGRTFWIKKTINTISDKDRVVISDLRFEHEVKEILQRFPNTVVIKIIKDRFSDDCSHPSEQEWKNIKENILLKNDGTIDQLYRKIDSIVSKM